MMNMLSITELDLLAKENPKKFVEYCRIFGIKYLDDLSDNDKALLYCFKLENVFDGFTDDMVKALMEYPIEA